ncbi:MAG: hypothetical protein KDA83_09250, partial [Planctomycetales bacterium]|nr:hypothetical protein [Planctomycetales bacterium]
MDFLNKSLQQIRELFDSMTTGAKITTVLLVGVLVVSLVYLFQYRSTGGESYLLGGREFSQAELGAMEGALAEAGVTGFEIVGYRLKLPRGNYDAAVAALSRAGALPMSVDSVDDPNQTYNPLLTRAQEEERQKDEKKTKFRAQFSQNNKLEYAHLEYDTQIVGGLEKRRVTTAVVSARARGGKQLDRETVDTLVAGVRGFLVGIKPEDITIIDDSTLVHFRGVSDDPRTNPRFNPYAIAKAEYERDW